MVEIRNCKKMYLEIRNCKKVLQFQLLYIVNYPTYDQPNWLLFNNGIRNSGGIREDADEPSQIDSSQTISFFTEHLWKSYNFVYQSNQVFMIRIKLWLTDLWDCFPDSSKGSPRFSLLWQSHFKSDSDRYK